MAPSKKRKRESTDDDATYGLRQILPVANLPIDFDDEPLDGTQYLFLVRCVLSLFSELCYTVIRNDVSMYQQKGCTEASWCQARSQSLRLQSPTAYPAYMLYKGGPAAAVQRMAQQIRAPLS